MQRAGSDWLQLFGWLADRLGVFGAVVAFVGIVLAYLLVNGWLRSLSEKGAAPPSDENAQANGRVSDEPTSPQP